MSVQNLALSGVAIAPGSPSLFDGTVTPTTPGTLPGDDGRVMQWILGNDLETDSWTLTGELTGLRTDLGGINSVRFVVDLVRDTTIAPPVPEMSEPTSLALLSVGLAALPLVHRRRRQTRD